MNALHILHTLFGIIGNLTALFLFLAPIITFKRVMKNRSTEQFSGIPYVMTLLTNLLSAWYGLPFVSPHNIPVTTISGIGAVIESTYVLIFLICADKKTRVQILGCLLAVLSIFFTVALVSLFALHGDGRKLLCGLGTTICTIAMFASPLAVMRLVIKTKSVEYMPFFLSLFSFLSGTFWFAFGLLGGDPFVIIPNGVGCGLGMAQLILYAIYRKNRGPKAGGGSVAMGSTKNDNSNSIGPNNAPSILLGLSKTGSQEKPASGHHTIDAVV